MASTFALDAAVFAPGQTVHTKGPTIRSEQARLWLADSLGLSSLHSLKAADPDTLLLLNTFGNKQNLFEHSESRQKVLIVEGLEEPEG